MTDRVEHALLSVLEPLHPHPGERDRLVRLMRLLTRRPPPPDPDGYFPRYAELRQEFLAAIHGRDAELIEERFLDLYAHLHMHDAQYTPEERRRVDASGGYWCHAGGLSPLLKAGDWIRPDTVSADLGAGNGLQGLLLQLLYPHRLTIQVEISYRMVAVGRRLQAWLGIPNERLRWVVADVLQAAIPGVDFLYVYRPVRPDGPGRAFYRRLAAELEAADRPVVVFSIADCLRDFLTDRFEVFYGDGHLTCFRTRGAAESVPVPGTSR